MFVHFADIYLINMMLKTIPLIVALAFSTSNVTAFSNVKPQQAVAKTSLQMGWFDGWGGSGKDELDEQWELQQEILRNRRKPAAERVEYFREIERKRAEASSKQKDMWGWQSKSYETGEDPIDEWKKRRADGTISDLNDQYGDPKKVGGIPLPTASFGVGGEFGVG